MADCGETILANYANEEPCEQTSTDCVIYENAISYLSLEQNSTATEIIQALVTSLVDTRARLNRLRVYTVATLPSGELGQIATVTDALNPEYRTQVQGEGTEKVLVFYNGTNWIVH